MCELHQLKSYCVITTDGNQSSNRNYIIQMGGDGGLSIIFVHVEFRMNFLKQKNKKKTAHDDLIK